MAKPGFYAVKRGRTPGIFTTWDQAKASVEKYEGAVHKKFPTLAQAQAYLGGNGSTTTGITRPREREDEGDHVRKRARASFLDVRAKEKLNSLSGRAFSDPKLFVRPEGRCVWSDGSCRGNGKKDAVAGIGVYWPEDTARSLAERLPGDQTNNRAEMYAIARILETDPTPDLPLKICTDSAYTIGVYTLWWKSWLTQDWKTNSGSKVANQDLIRYTLHLIQCRPRLGTIRFVKVPAHSQIFENEEADRLANVGALMPLVVTRDFGKEERGLKERAAKERGKEMEEMTLTRDFEIEVDLFDKEDLLDEDELNRMEREQNWD